MSFERVISNPLAFWYCLIIMAKFLISKYIKIHECDSPSKEEDFEREKEGLLFLTTLLRR